MTSISPQSRQPQAKRQLTRRKAIDAKCRECIYDPHSGAGTWREQVAGCSSFGCPLHPLRPLPDTRDRRKLTPRASDLPAPRTIASQELDALEREARS